VLTATLWYFTNPPLHSMIRLELSVRVQVRAVLYVFWVPVPAKSAPAPPISPKVPGTKISGLWKLKRAENWSLAPGV